MHHVRIRTVKLLLVYVSLCSAVTVLAMFSWTEMVKTSLRRVSPSSPSPSPLRVAAANPETPQLMPFRRIHVTKESLAHLKTFHSQNVTETSSKRILPFHRLNLTEISSKRLMPFRRLNVTEITPKRIMPFRRLNHTKISSLQGFHELPPFHKLTVTEKRRVDSEIVEWSKVGDRDQADPLLNQHQYVYTISANTCRDTSPDVIIFLQSAVTHTDQRSAIRNTWGQHSRVGNITFRTVFFLGQTGNTTLQAVIQREGETFQDLVQGNFLDSYRNLTYKHVMALGWIVKECPDVKLIVKVDDDTMLNVFNLVRNIGQYGFREKLLSCSIYFHQSPVRYRTDKWFVSKATYPLDYYPNYCEGFGYLMSPDVARALYAESESTRFYWVDDVYVTGFLALKINLILRSFGEHHGYMRTVTGDIHWENALFIYIRRNWYDSWNALLKRELSWIK